MLDKTYSVEKRISYACSEAQTPAWHGADHRRASEEAVRAQRWGASRPRGDLAAPARARKDRKLLCLF